MNGNHHPVVVRGYVDRVEIGCGRETIAAHPRWWGRERQVFDPVHYLPLLERKAGGLDHALPLDRRENVLLVGNSGTGKTHLATALAFAACAQGRRVRSWTVTALVTHLVEAREERQLERTLKHLERHALVVLDELGYVPFSKAGSELLFEVVSRAYERTSLVVTTNLPFEAWPEVCGSERLTGAILDRLTHRVHILEANGESYRLRDSQRRQKARKA